MRLATRLLLALLIVALVVASVGWFRASERAWQRFDSCRIDGPSVVLTYSYGVNQRVSPSADLRGPDMTVALYVEAGEGVAPAIAMLGEARFTGLSTGATVRYPDGTELDCPPATASR